jgi:hypothetical protein
MMSNSPAWIEDLLDRQVEPGRRVAAVAGRPERLLDGRHERAGTSESPLAKRHLMAAPVELLDELVDDALRPAIRTRRDTLHGGATWAMRSGRVIVFLLRVRP